MPKVTMHNAKFVCLNSYIISELVLLYIIMTLYCEGIGLSDGEVMERLWSYLRRFGRMTKEMHPSHCSGQKKKRGPSHANDVTYQQV